MKAIRIETKDQVCLVDTPRPEPRDGDVLLKVRHVGLCGSDLANYRGLNPLASYPRIPGHEIGGEIAAIGTNVPSAYTCGKRAIVVPYTSCGKCSSCRQGRVNACRDNRTLGVQQEGGLADYIVLPHAKLLLNDTLPAAHLALVEPLSVGFHAARRGRVTEKDIVVVLGTGMIGLGVVAGAAARGATVIAVDVTAEKAEAALALGAAHAIASADVTQAVADLTGGHGADVVIEAVGTPETFTQAVDLVCYCGRVVYVGYAKEPVAYKTQIFNLKELDILGSRNALPEDFAATIPYLEKLGAKADKLITKRFSIDNAAEAFPYWLEHRDATTKILIEC